jgi:hypothetical protein
MFCDEWSFAQGGVVSPCRVDLKLLLSGILALLAYGLIALASVGRVLYISRGVGTRRISTRSFRAKILLASLAFLSAILSLVGWTQLHADYRHPVGTAASAVQLLFGARLGPR